ncbi:ParB/RepB/Spo0J family partition protein [Desulfogranum japonicum]|uniref:ParB/RepB/Spo0J family partition protein n=1 Tax=Desulfogranum japonicum TaxID=231447 RepID=UPI0003FC1EE8|nr:ParB/RepB/Spo0J family partition protein [Desulfogranum japonicum]
MSKKSVLGRGVGALLSSEPQEDEERFFLCDIDKIDPNPDQPRSYFDPDKLEQLCESIKEKGVIQPLLVVRSKNNRYNLIAGERRLRAAKMAQQEEVPVVVMEEKDDSTNLELALIENIQRHDLNPIEEALAYSRLVEEFNLTQEEVAKKVGRKRSTVTNVLRLLNLPDSIQNDVSYGNLSEGHARVLLRLKDDPRRMQEVRDKIIKEDLSVRATEKLCKETKASAAEEQKKTVKPEGLPKQYCTTVVTQITNRLNTKVRIVQNGKRGKLEIDYYSSDDLDRLVSLLSKE